MRKDREAMGIDMRNAVKIRTLTTPQMPFTEFDPGEYLCSLEFYETDCPLTEEDRDGLAQFAHLLAFMALRSKSTRWNASTIKPDTMAYQAFESHFGHLPGWRELANTDHGVHYRKLANFLMGHYPPRLRG
jgi:hypothetical protein